MVHVIPIQLHPASKIGSVQKVPPPTIPSKYPDRSWWLPSLPSGWRIYRAARGTSSGQPMDHTLLSTPKNLQCLQRRILQFSEVKCVCKCIHKGSVPPLPGLWAENKRNEDPHYVVRLYLSTNETFFFRFFGFPIHKSYPTIVPLMVHFENWQRIYFTTETVTWIAEQPKDTTLIPLPRHSSTPKSCHTSNGTKNTVFGESVNKANTLRNIPASSYHTALAESAQSTLTNRNAFTSAYYCKRYEDPHHSPISKESMDTTTQHTMRLACTVGYWRTLPNGILWWPKLLPCILHEDWELIDVLLQSCEILQPSGKNLRMISQKTTGTKASCYFQILTLV